MLPAKYQLVIPYFAPTSDDEHAANLRAIDIWNKNLPSGASTDTGWVLSGTQINTEALVTDATANVPNDIVWTAGRDNDRQAGRDINDTATQDINQSAGRDFNMFGSNSVSIDGPKIGFYAAAPVAQAAHPVTLGDVITLLTNLGLCA